MSSTVYIDIRHWLFWYGNYGFCENSCNDEITIYQDKDKKEFLGYFEVTTYGSLEFLINNEEGLESDMPELYKEIKEFFNKDIENVEILDIATYEEVELSYNEDYVPNIK